MTDDRDDFEQHSTEQLCTTHHLTYWHRLTACPDCTEESR